MNADNLEIYIRAQAIIAKMEGMKIANLPRNQQYPECPQYGDEDFQSCAAELRCLSMGVSHD